MNKTLYANLGKATTRKKCQKHLYSPIALLFFPVTFAFERLVQLFCVTS